MGRPSLKTPELVEAICARLAEGKSLNAICKDEGFPPESTVRRWAQDDADFAANYARARDLGLDCRADKLEDKIAAEKDVARARLLFDAERWYLSKLAPKRYGDKIEHSGTVRQELVTLAPGDADL